MKNRARESAAGRFPALWSFTPIADIQSMALLNTRAASVAQMAPSEPDAWIIMGMNIQASPALGCWRLY